MTYGHAERTLAAIRLLEAETRTLLASLDRLSPEQAQWLDDGDESASYLDQSADVALFRYYVPGMRVSPEL
jgi:hypothetical protein